MFKRIAEKDEGTFEGYVYTNEDGDDEFVKVYGECAVTIKTEHGGSAVIYTDDIPKLIRALQMAYEYNKGHA